MAQKIILERLILEIEFDTEQAYQEFAADLQIRLFPEIQGELERVLSTFFENQGGNHVIDILEIDLPPLPFTVLKSAELKDRIGAVLAKQLADALIQPGESPPQTKGQELPMHSPDSDREDQWKILERDAYQSASDEDSLPGKNLRPVTERQSIYHYLLTGRFYPGMEYTIQHIASFLENEEEQISLIRWIQGLHDTSRQYRILNRLVLQLPANIVEAVLRHPGVKAMRASFPQPDQVPVSNTDIGGGGLYVENAGVVIIAPYFPALFQKSGLLNDAQKAFKDEQSAFYAIHLLQYLANKSPVETEDSTFLFKLLCGLQFNTPIGIPMEVADAHKQLADRLLLQVLKNWDIKLGDKIDHLRGSFFIRSGKLAKLDLHWLLTVETKMYDEHLFKKLPWSFKRILLPWMPRMLQVDWY